LIDEDNEAKYKANKRIYSSDFDGNEFNFHLYLSFFFIIKKNFLITKHTKDGEDDLINVNKKTKLNNNEGNGNNYFKVLILFNNNI
jgi:uncharacterized protein YrzB (UPF0473 family)